MESKSARLRVQDLQAILRIVGECRDLGDVPVAWREHCCRELGRLTRSGIVILGELAWQAGEQPRPLAEVTWGWENGFNKAAFEQAMADHRDDMSPSLLISGYLGDAPREPGRCLARTDLVSDSDWYGSPYFEILHKPMGYDHSMFCMREFSSRSGVHCCFTISRALRDADFSRRDRVLVQELNAALAPLVGGSLATLTDPSPADLAPRVRQVLRCLLEGDSDKQIAQRLGLARHTVNQYVKTIFHHFGVRSRTELLARWIRRAWSNGFNWADQ